MDFFAIHNQQILARPGHLLEVVHGLGSLVHRIVQFCQQRTINIAAQLIGHCLGNILIQPPGRCLHMVNGRAYLWLALLNQRSCRFQRSVQIIQGCVALVVIGAMFAVLGLSMLGVFSLPIPGWGRGKFGVVAKQHKTKRSLLSVLVLGLISGIIASPCVAPVIGALLIWISQAGRIWLGFWALFVFGWGMGLLLIVVGLTGWAISSGKWMVSVKAVLGILLVLVGLWSAVRGIQCKPLIPEWLMGGTKTEAVAEQPPTTTTITEPKPAKIEWLESESEGLALADKTGKPVLIEFYTERCGYCALMDRTTFRDKRVIKELERFVAVKMNLTRYTPEAEAAAWKYNVIGVPMFAFIDTRGQQTIRSGYMPADRFLRILQNIK